jgi:hypothetical protein
MSEVPSNKTTHSVDMQADLLTQFQRSDKLRDIVDASGIEIQRAEDLLSAMITDMLLANAEGVQLDRLGRQVDFPRLDISDDDEYRRLISVRIAALHSKGYPEDILYVASQMMGVPVKYQQTGQLAFTLSWEVTPSSSADWLDRVWEQLDTARHQCAEMVVIETTTGGFRFDSSTRGLDNGKLGLAKHG